MKQSYLFLSALLLFITTACKQRVYLTVTEPAAVQLSPNYKNPILINRTFAAGKSRVLERIDNGLSLEGKLDEKGSAAAVRGVFDRFTTNQRFDKITLIDSMAVENRVSSAFPAQLSWDEVEAICNANNGDFLVVLEVYNTDTKIDYSTGTTTKTTPLGTVQVPTHNARMTTRIKTGWRIYDPYQKIILDEFFLEDRLFSNGSGINPVVAAAALLNREQAVTQISTQVGDFYAGRIESQRFRVWRNYYNKGSRNLKMANRRAEAGDWDGAAELWEKELTNNKRKVAGRAHYNMAIYKEIIGDPYGALELAQTAYGDYRIKEGLVYADILRDRIARIEQAKRVNNQN